MRTSSLIWAFCPAGLMALIGCDSEPAEALCHSDAECPPAQLCDLASGRCYYECVADTDCGDDFLCVDHRCVVQCPGGELECPDGMVSICGAFCIDVYEASRPDATASQQGTDGSMALSRAGVIPWYVASMSKMNQTIASAACQAASKRLCTLQEWKLVCGGTEGLKYGYGNEYDPSICNGIDTYCVCEPYPHCYEACGANFHVMPTGAFPDCTTGTGVFDINGNVWELVASTDGADHYRGGAYNCKDSELLHSCAYDAVWSPAAKGFRCCADGEQVDGG